MTLEAHLKWSTLPSVTVASLASLRTFFLTLQEPKFSDKSRVSAASGSFKKVRVKSQKKKKRGTHKNHQSVKKPREPPPFPTSRRRTLCSFSVHWKKEAGRKSKSEVKKRGRHLTDAQGQSGVWQHNGPQGAAPDVDQRRQREQSKNVFNSLKALLQRLKEKDLKKWAK